MVYIFNALIVTIFRGGAWSKRMKNILQRIETEYVLITCDDHFIVSPVNTMEFEKTFSIMKKNKKITTISFVPHISPDEKTKWIGNFGLWKMNKSFRVNLDTAIWRKNKLERLLRDDEDIWQFEVNGTERALWDFTEYYKYKTGVECIINAPFNQRVGYGVVKGKWCWRMPELFNKYGIEMDFSVRGIMTREECIATVEKDNEGDAEYLLYLKHHPINNFMINVKKRIPRRQRIMLSKVKQVLLRRIRRNNGDS